MVLGILRKLRRKRQRTFLVFLSKRGTRKLIGRVQAEGFTEAVVKVHEMLEKMAEDSEMRDALSRFRSVVIMDLESGEEERIPNPLYEEESEESGRESSSRRTAEKAVEMMEASMMISTFKLFNKTIEGLGEVLKDVMKIPLELQKEVLKASVGELVRMQYDLVKEALRQAQGQSQLSQLLESLMAMGMLKGIRRKEGEGGGKSA